MPTANVWFVTIDDDDTISRPNQNWPTSTSDRVPEVTTIHVVDWGSKAHKLKLTVSINKGITHPIPPTVELN